MTKLYYTKGSDYAFITAFILKLNIDCEYVDSDTKLTSTGIDYKSINPKGYGISLILDDNTVLNESASILQWLCDQVPDNLAPPYGSKGRYLIQQAINYFSSELYMTLIGLFSKDLSDERRRHKIEAVKKRLAYINDEMLNNKTFLVDEKLSIADIYLLNLLNWALFLNFDLYSFHNIKDYCQRGYDLEEIRSAKERLLLQPTSTF